MMLTFLPIVLGLQLPGGVDTAEASAVAAVEADSVLRTYDLSPLLPHFDDVNSWGQSLFFPPAGSYDGAERIRTGRLYKRSSAEMIVDVVTQILGDELRYEGREVSLDGSDRLIVLAPPAVQAMIQSAIGTLESALSNNVELSMDILTFEGAGAEDLLEQNVLSPDDADRLVTGLLGRGAEHENVMLRTSVGRTTLYDSIQRQSMVFDFDVEIAQGAFTFDPSVVDVEHGTRVALRGSPGLSGLFLSIVFQQAELIDGVKSHSLRLGGALGEEKGGLTFVAGPKEIQRAEVLTRSLAFDTYMPEGSALAFSSHVEVGGQVSSQVVVLRRTGSGGGAFLRQDIPDSTRTLFVLNTESLSPPTLTMDGPNFSIADVHHPALTAYLHAKPSLFLFDWIKYRFKVWRRLGPWAIVVTDPSMDDDADASFRGLIQGAPTEVDVLQTNLDLRARGVGSSHPIRASLPLRAGSECGILAGITSSMVHDFDVEVAQIAAVDDPVVYAVLNGLAASVRPSRMSDDSLIAEVQAIGQLAIGPTNRFDSGSPTQGALEQPKLERLEVNERVTLRAGEAGSSSARLGDTAKKGDGVSVHLNLWVRP